jgi:predicted amidohydrolase YtcJ
MTSKTSVARRAGLRNLALGLTALATILPLAASAAEPADYVFRNGAVYTVDAEKPWAQAVAVSHGEIVYVGSDDAVKPYVGGKTQVVDLHQGMLLPGFIDSHTHLHGATALLDVPMTLRGRPPEEVLASVRKYVAEHPGKKMITGRGFIVETFLPNGPDKRMLDPIIPDVPAVMSSVDSHFMWVNSKTLELAGIIADTPDPEPGVSWFQRYPGSREPTGYVIEGAAMHMIVDALEKKGFQFESRERYYEGLSLGLPMLAAAGITSLYDAGGDVQMLYPALRDLESKGKMPVRVFGSVFWGSKSPSGDTIKDFAAARQEYHSDTLRFAMIKVAIDGSDNNHTAFMLDPYADAPDLLGTPIYTQAQFDDIMRKVEAAKFDLHVHVVGDGAIREALNSIEMIEKEAGPRDRRIALAHVNIIHPDDIARFRDLGVIWNSTPSWSMMTPRNITIGKAMGEPRFSERFHRFQTPASEGVIMNIGSDFATLQPGAVYKPLDHLEIGHTRQALGDPNFEMMPEAKERGSLTELIRAYTINGAYMLRMEDKIGSIRVGKRADLVALGKNLFEVSPYAIHTVPVRMTMVDGKVTYQADAAKLD